MSKSFNIENNATFLFEYSLRDSNKNNATNPPLVKKSSNDLNLDETTPSGQSQIKLMPILEGGESEDKSIEQPRLNTEISLTTTIHWTPTEYILN